MNNLDAILESILFYRGEPVSVAELAKTTGVPEAAVEEALEVLRSRMTGGLRLVREGKKVTLATAPEAGEVIEKLKREELEGPLGKAGLETLAIIVYQGPVSRADIEYVRGVNCTAILRSLTMRGLIERIENQNGRGYAYQATTALPAALGLSTLAEMPEYESMRDEITKVVSVQETEPHQENADAS